MKRKMRLWGTIVSISLLVFGCNNNRIEISGLTVFEQYLDFQILNQPIRTLSVVIFKGDSILYENYFGESNLEQETLLEQDDLFLLSSLSKMVTVTALMQLYEKGEFELDSTINEYLPFKIEHPVDSITTPITFRMLLTNTSGIIDGSSAKEQYFFEEDSPVSLSSYLENYLTPGGDYYDEFNNFHPDTPGNHYKDTNIGSALIGLLVEEISGIDFNTYCKENIFQPLGMEQTFWRLDESIQSGLGLVQPYQLIDDQFQPIQHYTIKGYPNGGLRSNGRDLAKFLSAFAQNGSSNNFQLLGDSTIQAMLTPQIPDLSKSMGFQVFHLNPSNNLWGHRGNDLGASTIMAVNPATKIGAIILTNLEDIDLKGILIESYEVGLEF